MAVPLLPRARLPSALRIAALAAAPFPPRAATDPSHSRASSSKAPSSSTGSSSGGNSNAPRPQRSDEDASWGRHRAQYNVDPFTPLPSAEHYALPLVDAAALQASHERPRSVRMLARDFIHDSLYNPHYGYFSRHAVLLPDAAVASSSSSSSSSGGGGSAPSVEGTDGAPLPPLGSGFDFSSFANERAFAAALQQRYDAFEASLPPLSASSASAPAPPTAPARPRPRPGSAEALEEAQRRGREMVEAQQHAATVGAGAERAMKHEEDVRAMAARQVWHTPTELFKPHYAHAIARYLCAEYKLNLYPYDDLVTYELGAGSGALAADILGYLRESEPEIYARTRYVIVEISERLAIQQRRRLREHGERVVVKNRSFLQWDEDVAEPCFVLALEVLDNLTHDVVRYSTATLEPYQAVVSIDSTGDMHELWERVSDPLIARYLALTAAATGSTWPPSAPRLMRLLPRAMWRMLEAHMPFYPNLTPPHYIPTGQLQMLDVLRAHFPQHRLVASDFHALPDALKGVDAPVVQTRLEGTMVPVTTYRVLQGFFDIFFPTNFELMREVYARVMAAPSALKTARQASAVRTNGRPTSRLEPHFFSTPALNPYAAQHRREQSAVFTHAEFLSRYADTNATRLRDGTNPLLTWYQNASWILT